MDVACFVPSCGDTRLPTPLYLLIMIIWVYVIQEHQETFRRTAVLELLDAWVALRQFGQDDEDQDGQDADKASINVATLVCHDMSQHQLDRNRLGWSDRHSTKQVFKGMKFGEISKIFARAKGFLIISAVHVLHAGHEQGVYWR